jgi:hypothetical protein
MGRRANWCGIVMLVSRRNFGDPTHSGVRIRH